MIHKISSRLKTRLRDFVRREDGVAAVEFCITLPIFLAMFLASFDAGILSTRQMMLERGLDVTVRAVRIGQILDPDHEVLIEAICDNARILIDCDNQLRLEMVVRTARAWVPMGNSVQCVDREEEGDPLLMPLATGGNNQLMILRACILLDPVLPGTAFARGIPRISADAYGLTATTSFVLEPFK